MQFSYAPCLPASATLSCLPSLSPSGLRSDGNHDLGNVLAQGGGGSVKTKSVWRYTRTVAAVLHTVGQGVVSSQRKTTRR